MYIVEIQNKGIQEAPTLDTAIKILRENVYFKESNTEIKQAIDSFGCFRAMYGFTNGEIYSKQKGV